mmetsp:Transcript_102957/g.296492  ORF Transcript_102957/g.296492 Transcript_102957/m.296492 type:complete len:279 (-) Transcript_102957:1755-2591(-)
MHGLQELHHHALGRSLFQGHRLQEGRHLAEAPDHQQHQHRVHVLRAQIRPLHKQLELVPQLPAHLDPVRLVLGEEVILVVEQPKEAAHRRHRALPLFHEVQLRIDAFAHVQLAKDQWQLLDQQLLVVVGKIDLAAGNGQPVPQEVTHPGRVHRRRAQVRRRLLDRVLETLASRLVHRPRGHLITDVRVFIHFRRNAHQEVLRVTVDESDALGRTTDAVREVHACERQCVGEGPSPQLALVQDLAEQADLAQEARPLERLQHVAVLERGDERNRVARLQ